MPSFTVAEYQRLVEIVATAAGTNHDRARYLVDTASRVLDALADKTPSDQAKVLALSLHTFGATTSPVFRARDNIPTTPTPDPVKVAAAREHLGMPAEDVDGEQEDDAWRAIEDDDGEDATRAYESSIAEMYAAREAEENE